MNHEFVFLEVGLSAGRFNQELSLLSEELGYGGILRRVCT